jgi:hypothetical protein
MVIDSHSRVGSVLLDQAVNRRGKFLSISRLNFFTRSAFDC